MSSMTRRTFAAGSAAAAIASTAFIRRARAAEFSFKYANNLPLGHPMNIRAQEAADKIKAETGGRFELQIFPSSQLGSDTDTLGQIRSGAVDFFTLSGNEVDAPAFRDKLGAAGFYRDWKAKYGDAAWATLEAAVGGLG